MLTGIAGANWSAIPGAEIELDDAEAARLIAAGHAQPATLEAAMFSPPENAALRTRPPDRRREKERKS